jgi:hypothetical protein
MKRMGSADAAIIVLRETASGFQDRDREIKVKHFSLAAPVSAPRQRREKLLSGRVVSQIVFPFFLPDQRSVIAAANQI